ncbi:MAG: DUF2339 domain-containing protein [Pseudohongiella sp.]
MGALGVVLVLALLIGAVLGWVTFFQIKHLRRELESLQEQLKTQSVLPQFQQESQQASPPDPHHSPQHAIGQTSLQSGDKEPPAAASDDPWVSGATTVYSSPVWLTHLQDQWMAWLGGLCVGLAGIFMVRYSIEQGLLGPAARITLALLTGIALHGIAEWLRRRSSGPVHALAAMAGGASMTLFAALLAALHLYQMLPPLLAFVLLALVALLTMALAVIHGPLMAIMGLISAYAIPLLVDTGGGNVSGVLAYTLVISAAAMVLMHFVYRHWLWFSMVLGSLCWWTLSLLTSEPEAVRGLYLAALAYLVVAGPTRDLTLMQADNAQAFSDFRSKWFAGRSVAEAPVAMTLLLIVLAFAVSIYATPISGGAIYYWTPLVVLLFLFGRHKTSLSWLPWLSLVLQAVAWVGIGIRTGDEGFRLIAFAESSQTVFMLFASWMTALYVGLALWILRIRAHETRWLSLALLSPLIWLTLCYLLVPTLSGSLLWACISVILGAVYLALAGMRMRKSASPEASSWMIVAGHFAYSLAVVILLSEASLTLALSAQLFSLAWVIWRFDLPHMNLLIKAVLAVVIARLTFNPWLLAYSAEVHWSLWSYGGSALFCALAAWRTDKALPLRRWLEAATLHLLVLTLWAETRYWLYSGDVFAAQFNLLEAAINTALWSSLGLVYHFRSTTSQSLEPLYQLLSKILLVLSLAVYALMLTVLNPYWSDEQVATTPVFNVLLLAYGFPVLTSALVYRTFNRTSPRAARQYGAVFKRCAAAICALAAFVFVSMQIRHLWQGQLDLSLPTGNAELYTYSAVWLVMAVAAMLAGAARYGQRVYRVGLGLLVVVIAKLFLVDMADLDGMLRVASFMGLGLSLLGLAYLYQKFEFRHRVSYGPDD